jgi:hypothetical protein
MAEAVLRPPVTYVREEGLALLCGIALVTERELLVCSSRELDKVEGGIFEDLAESCSLFGVEALILELDGVELDAEHER